MIIAFSDIGIAFALFLTPVLLSTIFLNATQSYEGLVCLRPGISFVSWLFALACKDTASYTQFTLHSYTSTGTQLPQSVSMRILFHRYSVGYTTRSHIRTHSYTQDMLHSYPNTQHPPHKNCNNSPTHPLSYTHTTPSTHIHKNCNNSHTHPHTHTQYHTYTPISIHTPTHNTIHSTLAH